MRRQIEVEGMLVRPDWSTMTVFGPVEVFSDRGDIIFEYRGAVECFSPRSIGRREVTRA